jgi:hypothetical protein
MRLSRWCSVARLIGFVLLLLASCPFTAPFKPVDLSTPVDGGLPGAAALLQAKSATDDPTTALAMVPVLSAPWGDTSVGRVVRVRPSPATRLLLVPLRI